MLFLMFPNKLDFLNAWIILAPFFYMNNTTFTSRPCLLILEIFLNIIIFFHFTKRLPMSLPKCFQHQLKLTSKHFTNDTSENHHLSFETSRYMRIVCSFEIRKPEMDCSWERNAFACVSCTVLISVLSLIGLKSTGILKTRYFCTAFSLYPL